MLTDQLTNPLQRFPVFSTSSSEEFRHALLTQFGAVKAEVNVISESVVAIAKVKPATEILEGPVLVTMISNASPTSPGAATGLIGVIE